MSISVVSFGQPQQLRLRAAADAQHGAVGHDDFGARVFVGIKRILKPERRILHRGHPILVFGHIAQQLPFHMVDMADQNRLFLLLSECRGNRSKQQSSNQTTVSIALSS